MRHFSSATRRTFQPPFTSTDGSTFNNVSGGSGGTTSTYTTPALTQTTYYRAQVTSGACSLAYSTTNAISVGTAPVITGGPSPTAACVGSTASFSVTNTGSASLNYAWRKPGSGWGQSWNITDTTSTGGGGGGAGHLVGSSAHPSTSDIGSSCWQQYAYTNGGGSQSTTVAYRNFPTTLQPLASGQSFIIDLQNPNGVPNSGAKVGFGLTDGSGNAIFEFQYINGATDWTIHDNAGYTIDTGVLKDGRGIHVIVFLTSTTTYSCTIEKYASGGGSFTSTNTVTGTFNTQASPGVPSGGIKRFYTWNINGGYNSDIYYNNLVVGPGADDNGGNYNNTWTSGATDTFGQSPLTNGVSVTGSTIAGATTTNLQIQTVQSADATNYDVVIYNTFGYTNSTATALTVNALPTVTAIVAQAAVCPNTTGNTATVITNAGATYYWSATNVNVSITGGQTATNVMYSVGSGATGYAGLTCAITNASGCYTIVQTNILISSSVGAAGAITGSSTVCSNASNVAYSIASVTGATGYTWTVPAGASIATGAGTASITVNFGTAAAGVTNITVTPTGACASGTPSTNVVTISAASAGGTVTASAASVCNGNSVTLTNSGYTGSNQWWTATNGGSFSVIPNATNATYTTPGLANTYTTNITISYYSVVSNNPCTTANSTTNTITVNPTSVGGTATALVTNLLSGLSTTVTLSGNIGTIQWQSSTDGSTFNNVSGGSGGTTATYTTPALTQTTYYRAQVTSGGCSLAYSTTNAISVGTAPVITAGPTNIAVCSGSTANFAVTASGTSLSYAWFKHANAGWGSSWTAVNETGGTIFLGSSTDNDNGASSCNSFGSSGDINTPSGNAWGLYGGTTGEQVTRTFPAAVTNGQVFQIDMDNGAFVNTGLNEGFSLHNAANNSLFAFFFTGGGSYYTYYDSTGNHTTSVPFTVTGLRITVIVGPGNPASYTLLIKPCGGSAVEYAGTFATTGNPDMVVMYNNNTSGTGSQYNLYFNNMVAGLAYDNADNYSGNWSGNDKGEASPISGATSPSYATSTGNNGDQYYALAYNSVGVTNSTAATLTVNALPTATITAVGAVCPSGAGTATVTTNAGATYSWGITNGTINSGQFGTNLIFTAGSSGANVGLTCTVTSSSGCSSSAAQVNVPITSTIPGAAGPITGSSTVCSNATSVSYLITNVPNATAGYTWTVPTGASIGSGQGTTNILVNFGTASGTGNVTVTPNGACANGTPSTNVVTISPTSVGGTVTASASAVCNGNSVTLTNSGYTGAIQWQQSPNNSTWSNVTGGSGATSAIYTTPALTSTTYYRAAVTNNPCSGAYSTTYTVTVGSMSTITSSPASQTRAVGNNVFFTVGTSGGSPSPIYQWRKGGVNLANGATGNGSTYNGATTATLTVSNVQSADLGSYDCTVSNGVCSQESSPATLTVNISPTITTGEPQNVATCSGGSVSFTNTPAIGAAAASYQWRKRGAGWAGGWSLSAPNTGASPSGSGFFVGSSVFNNASLLDSNNDGDINSTNSSIGNSSVAWGMYANNSGGNNLAEATRIVSTALSAGGQTNVQIDFDNGLVAAGDSAGITLRAGGNLSSNNRFEFIADSTTQTYKLSDSGGTTNVDTGVALTLEGVRVAFTLTGANTYSVSFMTLVDGVVHGPYTGTLANSGSIDRIRLYAYGVNASAYQTHDVYFNNLTFGNASDNASDSVYNHGGSPTLSNGDNGGGLNLSSGGNYTINTTGTSSTLTINSATPADATNYDVVVSVSGAQSVDSSAAALTVYAVPTINAVSQGNATCNGGSDGSIAVAALISADSIDYSTNGTVWQTATNFTGLPAGTYNIYVRNHNHTDCTATYGSTVTITQPSAVTVSLASQVNVTCNGGSDGSFTANTATGGSGTGYTYSDGGAYQASPVFSGLTAGGYTITAQDGNGCVSAGVSVTISQPTALSLGLTETDATTYGGSDGKVTATFSGGMGTLQVKIDGGSYSAQTSSHDFTGLSAGSHTVYLQDANGCSTSQSISVGQPSCAAPTIVGGINPGSASLCVGSQMILTLTNATGTTPLFYQWQTNSVAILNATNLSYTNLSVALTDGGNYTCVVSNDCGSITSAVATVTVNPVPIVTTSALANGTVGAAYSQFVTAMGGSGYTFGLGAGLLPPGLSLNTASGEISGTPTTACTGNFTVTVASSAGCVGSSNLSLTVSPASSTVNYTGTSFTYDGTAKSPAISFSGSTGAKTTNYVGSGYASVNAPTNAGVYYVSNTVVADANYLGVTNSQAFTINQAAVTFDLTSSESPAAGYKDSLTFMADSFPTDASGTVQFQTNGANLGSAVTISGGSAVSSAAAGLPRATTNVVAAIYSGDNNYLPLTNTLTQTVTNHPPVAAAFSINRTAGLSLQVALTNLAAHWSDADGDTINLVGVAPQSTNHTYLQEVTWSGTITTNTANFNHFFIAYTNSPNVNDQFSYTISDNYGGTNTGTVNVIVNAGALFGQSNPQLTSIPGGVQMTFYGIPGDTYVVQRELQLDNSWINLLTNTPVTGPITVTDTNNIPAAYYRLEWQP